MSDTAASVGEAEVERLGILDDLGRSILFYDARTANTFSDTPVSDQELRDIWNLAKWPPTSANTQPLRVLYVRTPEGKGRLLPHMYEGNRPKTESAPAVAVLAADLDFHEHIPTVFPARPEMKDYFGGDDAMRHGAARFNATLQAGYFLLAIRAAGLAAGPMLGFDAEGVDREFFPGDRYKSILVVNIGHPGPSPWFPRLPRLDDDTALRWA
jgi:3-hydroxypropanoate dehydrogenase